MVAISTFAVVFGVLALTSASLPIGANIPMAPLEEPSHHWVWECHIEEPLERGQIWSSRTYDSEGRFYSGDFFYWNSKRHAPSRIEKPIEWDISYSWYPVDIKYYDDRRAKLKIRLNIEKEMPWAALLQIQRPFPVEPNGIIGSTALSTTVFQGSDHGPKGDGYGELPLGDLLAYAGNFDELDWTVSKMHNQYGHAEPLASGKLDIAAFKEASAAIPRLKKGLEAMASDFRKNCKYEEQMLPPVVY